MKIKMIKEDVKKGVPCDSEACAISQALMREFNTNQVETSIKGTDINIRVNDQPYFIKSVDIDKVKRFIWDFDNLDFIDDAVPPQPITFELNQ